MDYFKINYNKLQNLRQIKFFKIVIMIVILLIILLILSITFKVYSKVSCYGIYSNNKLTIKINNELSDILKSSEYIIFNAKKTEFTIDNYGEYEIIDNVIYQEVDMTIDENFYDNEVGLVEFYYHKRSIFRYILDLFK